MLNAIEGGLVEKWSQIELNVQLYERQEPEYTNPKPLKMEDLPFWGYFLISYGTAILIFCAELIIFNFKNLAISRRNKYMNK